MALEDAIVAFMKKCSELRELDQHGEVGFDTEFKVCMSNLTSFCSDFIYTYI